ncbi:hypothetical protein GCM10011418_38740 [Sphingobacterium alkalisoli]|nr:hypothetical protein GCM10011418_38740 [Sphingobacterium alkalisoli]
MFKKSTKEKFVAKQSYEIEKSDNTKETGAKQESDNSKETSVTTDKSEATHVLTADEISIDKDGNLRAKGNVKYNGKQKNDIDTERIAEAFRQSNFEYAKESDLRVKEESKAYVADKSTVSEASGRGIIFGVVGALIFVLGILWYFGIRRK